MTIYSLQGQRAPSRDAAVAAAIGAATADFKDLAPSMTIHVLNVLEINGQWVAVVRVSLAPAFDRKAAEKKPMPQLKPAADDDAIEVHYEKTHKKPHELEVAALEFTPEPPVHIFIPSLLEPGDLYKAHHYEAHPHYHFHFLDSSSSLWKASLDHTLHADLYDSVNLVLDTLAPAPQPELAPELAPKRDKTRKPKGLTLGLGEEL